MITPDNSVGNGPENARIENGILKLDPFGPNDTYLLEGSVKGGMQPLTAQVDADRALRVTYGLNTFQDVHPLTITLGNQGLSMEYASGKNHINKEVRPNAVYGVALAHRTLNPQQEAVVLALSNDRYAIINLDGDGLIIQESLGSELVLDDHPTWVNATQGNNPVLEVLSSIPGRDEHATYNIGVLNTEAVIGGDIKADGDVYIGTTEISNHEPTPVDEIIENQGRIVTRKAKASRFNLSGNFQGAELHIQGNEMNQVYIDGIAVPAKDAVTLDFSSLFDSRNSFYVQAGSTQLVAVPHENGYQPVQLKQTLPIESTARGVELVLIVNGQIKESYFVGQDGTFIISEIRGGKLIQLRTNKIVDLEGLAYEKLGDVVVKQYADKVGVVFHGEKGINGTNRLNFDTRHIPAHLKWDEDPIAKDLS